MNKFFIFFSLFLLTIPFINAESEEVFKGVVYSGVYDTKNDQEFSLILSPESEKLMFSIGGNSEIIKLGACGKVDRYSLCLHNFTQGDFDRDKFEFLYKANVTVDVLVPRVYVEKKFPESVRVSQVFTYELSFGNNGNLAVSDFEINELIKSDYLEIISLDCPRSENKLIWRGELKPGTKNTCKVRLRALKAKDYIFKTSLFYDGFEKDDSMSMKINGHELNLVADINDDELFYKGKTNYTLSVEAKSNLELSELIVDFPVGIEVIEYDDSFFTQNENQFSYSGRLSDSATFVFEIQSNYLGEFEILTNAKYKKDNLKFDIEDSDLLYAYGDLIDVRFSNEKDNVFYVTNLGIIKFEDINVTYAVNEEIFSEVIPELFPKKRHEVAFSPHVGKNDLEVLLNYKSEKGQEFEDLFAFEYTGESNNSKVIDSEIFIDDNEKGSSTGLLVGIAIFVVVLIVGFFSIKKNLTG